MGTLDDVIRPDIAAKAKGPGPAKYVLPNQTGRIFHDPTRPASPAFSFGKRLGSSLVSPWSSPGPVHFIHSSQTRTGKEGSPSYSLRKRTKPLQTYPVPGPGTYRPERTPVLDKRRSPHYSFGTKGKERPSSSTPAPNTYSIKTTIGRDNSTRQKGPAYSMTGRALSGSFAEDKARTPGPAAYHCDRSDRFLRRTLSYSMLARNFGVDSKSPCPPPGSYSPERCVTPYRSPPEVSFGRKHSEYTAPVLDQY
ncbi:hypothetical protein LOD99_2796 [Oopsacas minuta]|uniref:Outer dense fiber protein 3-like protein 2 n=1 Tax=Oopsacas minuta TaxID=111878 RepID=A0AAV7K126_9METZ|nr:hypothetical protein LOD99_2796 [Oopsacas minuta]